MELALVCEEPLACPLLGNIPGTLINGVLDGIGPVAEVSVVGCDVLPVVVG